MYCIGHCPLALQKRIAYGNMDVSLDNVSELSLFLYLLKEITLSFKQGHSEFRGLSEFLAKFKTIIINQIINVLIMNVIHIFKQLFPPFKENHVCKYPL